MRTLLLAIALLASPAVAQTASVPPVRVLLTTSAGPIVIDVDIAHAPISGRNFLRYVDRKLLDGVLFYRTVKVGDRFGFVQFGSDGELKRSLPPIAHEPTTVTGLKHLDGTISTARLAPGTARGEFTISVGAQPSFDADPTRPGDNAGYAAFGRVEQGSDTVLKIFDAPVSPTKTVRGAFKGAVPEVAVRVVSARRLRAGEMPAPLAAPTPAAVSPPQPAATPPSSSTPASS